MATSEIQPVKDENYATGYIKPFLTSASDKVPPGLSA